MNNKWIILLLINYYLKGPCEGDSGGPLFINYGSEGRKRQTLEGITSGGLSCGQNFPSWYTRVCCKWWRRKKLIFLCFNFMHPLIVFKPFIFSISFRLHHIALGSCALLEMSEKASESHEWKKCARKKVEVLKKKI